MATRIERRRYKWLKATSKKAIYGPFDCPSCGSELLFQTEKEARRIYVKCACGLEGNWTLIPGLKPVDYYNRLIDSSRKNEKAR